MKNLQLNGATYYEDDKYREKPSSVLGWPREP